MDEFVDVFVIFQAAPSTIVISTTVGWQPKAVGPPMEAAEGRLHYGGWGGLKKIKNILGKWVANMYDVANFSDFPDPC